MNRKERRAYAKKIQKTNPGKGINFKDALAWVNEEKKVEPMEEGMSVKLNYELMRRQKDWIFQNPDFIKWVEEHKDEVFTVEWEPERKEKDSPEKKFFVNLKEDTTDPKWIVRADSLIPITKVTINLNNGKQLVVPLEGVGDPNDNRVKEAIEKVIGGEDEGED